MVSVTATDHEKSELLHCMTVG